MFGNSSTKVFRRFDYVHNKDLGYGFYAGRCKDDKDYCLVVFEKYGTVRVTRDCIEKVEKGSMKNEGSLRE